MRGDVPLRVGLPPIHPLFSPRARGCSLWIVSMVYLGRVFPACAGMFLIHRTPNGEPHRFPRVRGDVPNVLNKFLQQC